jgi:hypothetical protein
MGFGTVFVTFPKMNYTHHYGKKGIWSKRYEFIQCDEEEMSA